MSNETPDNAIFCPECKSKDIEFYIDPYDTLINGSNASINCRCKSCGNKGTRISWVIDLCREKKEEVITCNWRLIKTDRETTLCQIHCYDYIEIPDWINIRKFFKYCPKCGKEIDFE